MVSKDLNKEVTEREEIVTTEITEIIEIIEEGESKKIHVEETKVEDTDKVNYNLI